MSLSTVLRISRPRFWHYVLWPMLIYFASNGFLNEIYASWTKWWTDWIFQLVILFIILWYFTLPANLRIYGWNDIADGDTDKFNAKKWTYEEKIGDSTSIKNKLKWNIRLWNIGYIVIGTFIGTNIMMIADCFSWTIHSDRCSLFITNPISALFNYANLLWIGIIISGLLLFLLASYLYSCKPLRAKAKPFIDGIMNILYISTPFSIVTIQYYFWSHQTYNLQLIIYNFFAALLRCMAMHCYSAIPDIEPDRQAWLTTTAVYLGKQNWLIYCAVLYLLSAVLSFSTLWWFSIVGWTIYISVMILSMVKKDLFALYKLFPYINLIIWFLLFRYIILYL